MVSQKKIKPKTVDLTSSLSMISGENTQESVSENTTVNISQIQTGAPVENKENTIPLATKDTQIIFRTTEANKNSLKGFFASHGFTLSKGIQLACFYLEQEIKAGNITIGPAGIIKKEK